MLGNFSKKDDLLKKSVPPRRPITDKKLKSSYGHLLYHKIHARALFKKLEGLYSGASVATNVGFTIFAAVLKCLG